MEPVIRHRLALLVISIASQHAAAQVFTRIITVVGTTLAAIQEAIDAVSTAPGTRALVIVPRGEYDFGVEFLRFNKWGVTLRGEGPGLTVFKSFQVKSQIPSQTLVASTASATTR
jgi:pectin methylesterase-like acyl-CoA thioesterase